MRCFGVGAAAVCLMVAGCAVPVYEVGEFVPVRQLLAETEGLPYQCGRMREDQESCNLIATLRRAGGGYVQVSQFALDLGGTTFMQVSEQLEERNGAICVVTEAFTTISPNGGMLDIIDGTSPPAPPLEPICYAYFRNPEGGYLSAELDAQGRLDPLTPFPVAFLAERPGLQAMGLGF